jgi:hypothetical protein
MLNLSSVLVTGELCRMLRQYVTMEEQHRRLYLLVLDMRGATAAPSQIDALSQACDDAQVDLQLLHRGGTATTDSNNCNNNSHSNYNYSYYRAGVDLRRWTPIDDVQQNQYLHVAHMQWPETRRLVEYATLPPPLTLNDDAASCPINVNEGDVPYTMLRDDPILHRLEHVVPQIIERVESMPSMPRLAQPPASPIVIDSDHSEDDDAAARVREQLLRLEAQQRAQVRTENPESYPATRLGAQPHLERTERAALLAAVYREMADYLRGAADCTICMSPMDRNEQTLMVAHAAATATQHLHIFHAECLRHWVLRTPTSRSECPLCRVIVSPEVIEPLASQVE